MPSLVRLQKSKVALAKRARFEPVAHERLRRRNDPWRDLVLVHSEEVVARVEHEIRQALRPVASTSKVEFAVRPVFDARPARRGNRIVLRAQVKLVPRDPEQFRARLEDIEHLLELDDD